MWFAALGDPAQQPWLVHLMAKLLEGDAGALSLLRAQPFPDGTPRYVRARLYRYELTSWGESGWWRRELVGEYLPALSLEDPRLSGYLEAHGWSTRRR
jgi:hypothetical protein